MADIDYEKLGDAVARSLRRGGSGSGSGFSGGAGEGGRDAFKKSLENVGDDLKSFGSKVSSSAGEYVDTLRTLTRAGSNFSNDIIGMGVAAAESRVSLQDFSTIIVENGKFLSGLGGSVTRGTEAFAKLSKGFFESGATDELRQMGYTSKELNDVLAIQLGTQRATFQNDEEGRKRAFQAANALAKEMDMISKLTGKNREELAEEAKKRRTDGQIEAKLRLIGIEKGADAEKAAREAFQKQFAEAEARGMGQMAKELFATGTLTSDEAATQFAVMGEAASKTRSQMLSLAEGNVAAAEAYSKEAQAATARLQRDPTFLRLATLGEAAGQAGTAAQKNVEVNMALNDAVQAVAKTMKPGLTNSLESFGQAIELVRKNISESRTGQREVEDPKTGEKVLKKVDGATEGLIALETGMQNIQAGIASSIEVQNKAGESVGNAARQIGTSTKEFVDAAAPVGVNLGKYIETLATLGNRPATVNTAGMSDVMRQSAERDARGGAVGTLASSANQAANIVANGFSAATATIAKDLFVNGNLNVGAEAVPGRDTGSIGKTGSIIEDFGQGTLTMLHGKEGILTEEQMKALAIGAKADGVAGAVSELKSAIPEKETQQPSINYAQISKDISTTISSSVSGGGETTTRRVQSDSSKEAEAEMEKLREQYKKDRGAIRDKIKSELGPDAKFADIMDKMKESVEAQDLSETYYKKQEELQKVIDAGINYEIEKKQQGLQETKEILNEELKLTKDIVGQDVSALSDEMIESMLPEGAILEDYFRDIDGKLQKFSSREIDISNLEDASKKIEELTEQGFDQEEIEDYLTGITGSLAAKEAALKAAEADMDTLPSLDELVKSSNPLSDAPKDTPRLDLNSFMPGFSQQIKTASASIPSKKQEDKRKEDEKAAAAQNKPAEKTEKATEKATSATSAQVKPASLDDVVKSLNQLNMMMGRLIGVTEEFGGKQVKATMANNQNGFVR